ncbi:metal-dependent hydrolase [Halobacterium jilantaiense]|uniref:LexA-binding, inner membrane-associated putative hydrolase n=1 Tax=Halobacterium jilantaiense TaxID=355548 RepID=A0A1I0MRK5_9EURY|nr:metal-dependent hydrolase [Halobacterium jilantaiense]SEV90743.1 LexA-binding, inner membrane-associated putative hydrolase [Halobacterium jilantaiense]
MWPWEHVAVGYLAYSACSRLVWGEPPSTRGALVVGVAAVAPDLVDKPLAWILDVLPAGKSLAHSLFALLPLAAVATALGVRRGSLRGTAAFVVGWAGHLAGDVLYPLAVRGDLRAGFLFWPLVPVGGGADGALPHVRELLGSFAAFLSTPRGAVYLAAELGLLAVALAVWVADGTPVLGALRRRLRRPTANS